MCLCVTKLILNWETLEIFVSNIINYGWIIFKIHSELVKHLALHFSSVPEKVAF